MVLTEITRTAVSSLISNKLRSFLTMLGVIIGVFAVVSLVSVGAGLEEFVTSTFNEMGSNLIIVAPGKVDFSDDPAKSFTNNQLEEKHIFLLETQLGDSIVAVTPTIRLEDVAEFKTEAMKVGIIGTNHKANNVFDLKMASGKFFNKSQQKGEEKVAVIGSLVNERLFKTDTALESIFKLNGERFTVVGVMKEQNQRFDNTVIMPYTTAKNVFEIDLFSSIGMKVKEGESIARVMKQAEIALLRDLDDTDFSVLSQEDILQSITGIIGILTSAVGALAGISLLVGGIGIMNIMLVSVTERTREIGLRKALGATSKMIATQFLLESIFISASGGIIGLAFANLLSLAIRSYISMVITPWSVMVALLFSIAVGIASGTYPAINAAKKDPIDALRYE